MIQAQGVQGGGDGKQNWGRGIRGPALDLGELIRSGCASPAISPWRSPGGFAGSGGKRRKRAPAETGPGHSPLLGIIPACFDSCARDCARWVGVLLPCPSSSRLLTPPARHTRGGKAEKTHDEMHNSGAGMQVNPPHARATSRRKSCLLPDPRFPTPMKPQ